MNKSLLILFATLASTLLAQANSPPAIVQNAYVDSGNQSNKKQLRLSFPHPTTAGDLLVVMAGWTSGGNPPFPQVSDDLNGDYTPVFIVDTPPANGASTFFAYLPHCEGGKTTVTIKLQAPQTNIQLNIVEIKGASQIEPYSPQQPNLQGSANGNNNPPTSGSLLAVNCLQTQNNNDIVLGWFSWNPAAALTLTLGNPIHVPTTPSHFASAYLIEPIGAEPEFIATTSKSVFFAGICVAFKAD